MDTKIIEELAKVIDERKENPRSDSYVSKLVNNPDRILEKIGEESTEVILATKNDEEIVHEIADLFFHLMVLTSSLNLSFDEVLDELRKRRN